MAVLVVGVFGLFSLVGGVIGYMKAKSRASLIAGTISGILLLMCAVGLRQDSRVAIAGSALIAILLGGRFLGTWRRNHRVMPDLLMVLLSMATLLAVAGQLVSH